MIQKSWSDLIPHSIAGVLLTGLFWAICSFLNEPVAGGILVVPALFLVTFLFTVWLVKRSGSSDPAKPDCCEGPVRLKGIAIFKPKPRELQNTQCLDTNLNKVVYR